MTPELATLLAAAVVMSVAGSFAPVFSGEAFIALTTLTQPPSHVLAIAIAVAVGQTIGKAVTFAAARAAIGRSGREQSLIRLMQRPLRWLVATPARPGTLREARTRLMPPSQAVRRVHAWADRAMAGTRARPVLLLSAGGGLPPLLPVTIYAARSPMNLATFTAYCATGRTLRMLAIAAAALSAAST